MIERVTINGLWRLPDIDFEIPAGIIGIGGRKGVGKTTFLEGISVLPFYGKSISRAVVGRKPSVKKLLGPHGRIKLQLDGGTLTRDARVCRFRCDDAELDADGLAQMLPSLDWFLAGPMAAQNKAGAFDRLVRKERQNIWQSILTPVLEPLSRLHSQAAAKRGEAEKALENAKALGRAMLEKMERYTVEAEALPMREARVVELTEKLSHARTVVEVVEAEWNALEPQILVAKRIRKLDSFRAKLQGGANDHVDSCAVTDDELAAAQMEAKRLGAKFNSAVDCYRDYMERVDLRSRLADELSTKEGIGSQVEKVPCGGNGIYGGCPLIADAVSAKNSLDGLRETIADVDIGLVDFYIKPSNVELLAAENYVDELLDDKKAHSAWVAKNAKLASIRAELDEIHFEGWMDVEDKVKSLRVKIREAKASVGRLVVDLNTATDTAAECRGIVETYREIEGTAGDLHPLERELELWKIIEDAYGPRGIPQHEVDAYGPGLCEIANELLHRATSGRWSVKIETTKPKSDGGSIEDMAVIVNDAYAGEQRRVETFSPGELSLIDTAFRVALVVGRNEIDLLQFTTLWFDEPTAHLNDADVYEWMQLMRVAVTDFGIRSVVLVSHQERLLDLCDHTMTFFEDNHIERSW